MHIYSLAPFMPPEPFEQHLRTLGPQGIIPKSCGLGILP